VSIITGGRSYWRSHPAVPEGDQAEKNDAASYYSNLGHAYFSKKEFEKAIQKLCQGRQASIPTSSTKLARGVQVKLASPEDQAHYDYVLAKLYARTGIPDLSLHYLKKAKEEGYRDFKDVYKDSEFAALAQGPSLRCTDGCEKRRFISDCRFVRCAGTQRIPRPHRRTNLSRARTLRVNSREIGRAARNSPGNAGFASGNPPKATGVSREKNPPVAKPEHAQQATRVHAR